LIDDGRLTTISEGIHRGEMVMSEPQITLFVGDAFRCERALSRREAALRVNDPKCERRVLFGDELDPKSFEMELRSTSLFALGRHFVVRQVERIKAAKALIPAIAGDIPVETFVTLIAAELKRTSPILKTCKEKSAVVSLPAPRGQGVAKAVREILATEEIETSPAAVRRLIFRNGGSLLGIAQEAKKFRSFAPGMPLTDEAVDEVVFPSAERTVYPFFDRLGERNLAGALEALAEVRDDPGRMLGGAIRHLARLTMVRAVLDQPGPRKKLSDAIGLPDWLCRRLADQAKRSTLEELSDALGTGVRLDVQVKSGSVFSEDALLQLVFAATRPSVP
jgi:DNA polymerase III delta subunit